MAAENTTPEESDRMARKTFLWTMATAVAFVGIVFIFIL